MIARDAPDVFPSGDQALRRATTHVFVLAELPTAPELLDIAERRRPFRGLAASYHFLSEIESRP